MEAIRNFNTRGQHMEDQTAIINSIRPLIKKTHLITFGLSGLVRVVSCVGTSFSHIRHFATKKIILHTRTVKYTNSD